MPAEVYYSIATLVACVGLILGLYFKIENKINSKVDQKVSDEQWRAINSIKNSLSELQAGNARMDERSESLLREIASLRKDLHLNARLENIEQHITAVPR